MNDLHPLQISRANNTLIMLKSLIPDAQMMKGNEEALLGLCFKGTEKFPLYDANQLLQEGKYKADDFVEAPFGLAIVNNGSLDSLLQVIMAYPKAVCEVIDELAQTEQGQNLLPILMVAKGLVMAVEEQDSIDVQAKVMTSLITKYVSNMEEAQEVNND
jgi:hypothetical protein